MCECLFEAIGSISSVVAILESLWTLHVAFHLLYEADIGD
jgi:hypothetical protein